METKNASQKEKYPHHLLQPGYRGGAATAGDTSPQEINVSLVHR